MLLERLDEMAAGALGSDGPQAMIQLQARGLHAVAMNEARALLEKVTPLPVAPSPLPVANANALALSKAEKDLWGWYLEWSRTARVAVTRPAHLRQLGFAASRTRRADEA